MSNNKDGLEALKKLISSYDLLNESYKNEFGEDSPFWW